MGRLRLYHVFLAEYLQETHRPAHHQVVYHLFFLTFFECLFIFAHRPAHHQVVDCLSFVTLFEGQPIIRSLRCINFVTSLVFETL